MRLYSYAFILFLLSAVFLNKTYGQLCQGSLGDAVVKITFGSGSNPGPPLTTRLTNYQFVNSDCPNDGFYTIENSTSNCFGNTWYSVSEDHTPGDVNGYMMVINASFNPGDFYVQKVDGLCENTTYEFAAWILNVLNFSACPPPQSAISPNVTFNIETTSGTILQTYNTGDIPRGSASWKQYGLFFKTPAGVTSVVIRMTNNAPGGCGNDLLLDDITFRPCGPLVTVSINDTTQTVDVCKGNTSSFTFTSNVSSGYDNPVFQWQFSNDSGITWTDIPGANATTYLRLANNTPGTYQYRLAVAQQSNISVPSCRVVSNVVSVNVNPVPIPAATNSGPGCTGKMLTLKAQQGNIFLWTGPNGFESDQQNPVIQSATLNDAGRYYLKVTSDKGCANTDSTDVVVNTSPTVTASGNAEICEGKSTQLFSTGSNILFYTWNPPMSLSDNHIANPVATPSQTTLYIVTASNNFCSNEDSVRIIVNKKPTADAGPDKIIIRGQSAVLNGVAGVENFTFFWSPNQYISSTSQLNPVVSPPAGLLTYVLNVVSNIGCGTATDTVLVKVYNDLYIPNAFTPNGDGKNDTWNIETLEAYPNAVVKVFNRYGELVYFNHGRIMQWDGKYKGIPQTSGVYVYIIDLKNGTKPIKGTVTIVL